MTASSGVILPRRLRRAKPGFPACSSPTPSAPSSMPTEGSLPALPGSLAGRRGCWVRVGLENYCSTFEPTVRVRCAVIEHTTREISCLHGRQYDRIVTQLCIRLSDRSLAWLNSETNVQSCNLVQPCFQEVPKRCDINIRTFFF